MPRNLPSPMITAVTGNSFAPCYLLDLQLADGTQIHAWTGFGSVAWNGNTYTGVGTFGGLGDVQEGSDVGADGTSVMLSGIATNLLNETLNDIQQGAPATIWLGIFAAGAIAGAYPLFGGQVDKSSLSVGPDTLSISLALETKMANMQRASNRRYTSADQRNYYPDDSGFNWQEVLCDIALIWGG